MLIVYSHNSIPIRLTEERWRHIVHRHVEMADQRERVLETIAEPDLIPHGDFGELLVIRFYTQTPLTSKFIVVAYREIHLQDGFVITAYLTNRPATGRVVPWKR
jgi:hypothetical protein